MIDSVLAYFDSETYLAWSRVQGILWTLADIVICYCLVECANLCRAKRGIRRHAVSVGVLWLTIGLSCLLPFVPSGTAFFRLELAITIPQFAIIVYVLLVNIQTFFAVYQGLVSEANRTTPVD